MSIKPLIKALETAGKILTTYQKNNLYVVRKKSDGTPVTNADLISNKILTDTLLSLTPAFPIISEENYSQTFDNGYYWLVDPLDGTQKYINKSPFFSISIALMFNYQPILGIIYSPHYNKIYIGNVEKQTVMIYDTKKQTTKTLTARDFLYEPQKFSITSTEIFIKKLKQNSSKLSQYFNKFFSLPNAYKFISIIEKEAQLYPRIYSSKGKGSVQDWDIAAGHAILKAVNGEIYDWDHKGIITYSKNNFSFQQNDFIASIYPLKKLSYINKIFSTSIINK